MVALPAPASKTGERRGGGAGRQNTWGPDWLGGRDLDKNLGHCTTVKTVGGPEMRIHLLVLAPGHSSRWPCSLYSCATIT